MKLHILGALVAGLTVLECQADVAHFLVGPVHPQLKDSYVLPLTKSEDIAEARRQLTIRGVVQIAHGLGEHMGRYAELAETYETSL